VAAAAAPGRAVNGGPTRLCPFQLLVNMAGSTLFHNTLS
jgi:hypothetical protein